MLLLNKHSIEQITVGSTIYCEVAEDRKWRLEIVELLLLEREQGNLDEDDLDLLEWLCTK